MALDEHDLECVTSIVDGYFKTVIAERDAKIEKLTGQVAALQGDHPTAPVPDVSDFPDLSDPCSKLPQTPARRRQESKVESDETRRMFGPSAAQQPAYYDALAHMVCQADPTFIDRHYRSEPSRIRLHSPLVDLLETRPHDGTSRDLLVHLPGRVLNHAESRRFRAELCDLDMAFQRLA